MKFPFPKACSILLLLGLFGCGEEGSAGGGSEVPFPAQVERLDREVLGRFEEARRALLDAPEAASSWMHLGMTFEAHSYLQLAIRCYRSAAAIEPDARTEQRLSIALAAEGQLPDALLAIEASIALKGDYAPSHLLRGNYLFDQGLFDDAYAAYGRARELMPRHLGGALGMARAELQRDHPQAAIVLLQENLARKPKEPSTRRLLHAAYLQVGETQKAQGLRVRWHSFPSLGPDPWAREFAAYASPPVMEQASLELSRGNPAAAVELLEPFVQANQGETNARAHLAWAYHLSGGTGRGLELLDASLALYPRDLLLLAIKASILEAQSKYAEALALCTRMLSIDPKHLAALEQRAGLNLRLKQAADSIADYRSVLALDRSRMQVWIGLGGAQMQAQLWDEALASYGQALALKPGAEEPLLGSLRAKWKLGQLEQAQGQLARRKKLSAEGRLLLQQMTRALGQEGGE